MMAAMGMIKPIQSSMLPLGAVLTACRIRGKMKTIMPITNTTLPIVIQFINHLSYYFVKIFTHKQHAPDIPGRVVYIDSDDLVVATKCTKQV